MLEPFDGETLSRIERSPLTGADALVARVQIVDVAVHVILRASEISPRRGGELQDAGEGRAIDLEVVERLDGNAGAGGVERIRESAPFQSIAASPVMRSAPFVI